MLKSYISLSAFECIPNYVFYLSEKYLSPEIKTFNHLIIY